MKNIFLGSATLFFLFAFQPVLNAQKKATWQGGAPGRHSDWSCAYNWKEGRIPDEFSDVIIPDVSSRGNFQPLIRGEVPLIRSLCILPGATLGIQPGGALEVSEPVEMLGNGHINNLGALNAQLPVKLHTTGTSALTLHR